jgi:hypothetical protein
MAKNDASNDRSNLNSELNQQRAEMLNPRINYSNELGSQRQNAYNTDVDTRNKALGAFQSGQDVYQNFADTGGYSPEELAKLRAGFSGGGGGGTGISNDDIRGYFTDPRTGYLDFSKTGGFSTGDLQNIRARSISPLRSTFENARDEMYRGNSLAGGNSANSAAALSQMTRKLGQQATDASRLTEAGISEQVQKGRLSGLEGLTGIDSQIAQMIMSNAAQNAAAGAAGSRWQSEQEQELMRLINSGRLSGAGGLTDIGNSLRGLLGTEDANTQGYWKNTLANQGSMDEDRLGILGLRNANRAPQQPGLFQQLGGLKGIGSTAASIFSLFGQKKQLGEDEFGANDGGLG